MPVNIFLCNGIDIIVLYLAALRLMVVFKGFPIDLGIIKTAVLNVISKQIFLFFTAPLINRNTFISINRDCFLCFFLFFPKHIDISSCLIGKAIQHRRVRT